MLGAVEGRPPSWGPWHGMAWHGDGETDEGGRGPRLGWAWPGLGSRPSQVPGCPAGWPRRLHWLRWAPLIEHRGLAVNPCWLLLHGATPSQSQRQWPSRWSEPGGRWIGRRGARFCAGRQVPWAAWVCTKPTVRTVLATWTDRRGGFHCSGTWKPNYSAWLCGRSAGSGSGSGWRGGRVNESVRVCVPAGVCVRMYACACAVCAPVSARRRLPGGIHG